MSFSKPHGPEAVSKGAIQGVCRHRPRNAAAVRTPRRQSRRANRKVELPSGGPFGSERAQQSRRIAGADDFEVLRLKQGWHFAPLFEVLRLKFRVDLATNPDRGPMSKGPHFATCQLCRPSPVVAGYGRSETMDAVGLLNNAPSVQIAKTGGSPRRIAPVKWLDVE